MRLNSTGSLLQVGDFIYSYRTPIYKEFIVNGEVFKVFNDTFYSMTTRKHQSKIGYLKNYADLILHNCPYGEWDLNIGLKSEIYVTKHELKTLENKTRKLGTRQAEQKEHLTKRLQELQKLYKEV